MPKRPITLTAGQVSRLRTLLAPYRTERVVVEIIAKLDKCEAAKPTTLALTADDLVEVCKGALGSRLILPLSGAAGVWGVIIGRLKQTGLTREQAARAARAAAVQWQGPVRLESIVRQADKLLHQPEANESPAQQDLFGGPVEI